MRNRTWYATVVLALLMALPLLTPAGGQHTALKPEFQTSDRCLACHNGLTTPSGEDVSIGLAWRAGMMANSSRDPYWQASVRRESLDHPESQPAIEDECSICHMPMARYEAHLQGRKGEIFSHLPFGPDKNKKDDKLAEDGVSCSLCHQIGKEKLGTRESFVGGFVIDPPVSKDNHPEYGPFQIQKGQQRIMHTSSGGFQPTDAAHIGDSALCGTCHTLYTTARGAGGKEIGRLPEQTPYQEWLHSDYRDKTSCQSCHMPEVQGVAPVTAVLGELREGVHRHTFVAANFFMLRMLNQYRQDLSVQALSQELTTASEQTVTFLQSQSARVSLRNIDAASSSGRLQLQVEVENLTGHKLPTAYPSRRAWLHLLVQDRNGQKVFESGALNPDGSIQGNDNDADPLRYEPHYREINSSDQVQIYESIIKDQNGHVTTGLLAGVGYLKDNRLLPNGFQKQTAEPDIRVIGDAADDPNFTETGDMVRYSVPLSDAQGPFHIDAELWYQPIGFRWAHNLGPYNAAEPRRFVRYYDSMSSATAVMLAHASATH
ncbi:MAG TPA: hypothetical protein VN872_03545 [Candidatus Acidoferrum sp.]|nr:hypothetical protein [Candidatus Acidoferrum sp.]